RSALSALFPYTTLFRSVKDALDVPGGHHLVAVVDERLHVAGEGLARLADFFAENDLELFVESRRVRATGGHELGGADFGGRRGRSGGPTAGLPSLAPIV